MNTHPAAELFPLIEGADYIRLCKDIRENGLRVAIVKHPDGSILDGRNRLKACEDLGIKPQFVEWSGKPGTEVEYVLSLNLSRRHLDTSQRAMVAARLANLRGGEKKSAASIEAASQPEAAQALKVGRSSVQRAKVVLEEGSKAQIRAVEAGEKTVAAVVKEIRPEAPKASKKPEEVSECDTLKAENERLLRDAESRDKELRFYAEAYEADEKTAPLIKKIKELTELNRILEERNNGLTAEKNAAVAQANRLRKQVERLEKK